MLPHRDISGRYGLKYISLTPPFHFGKVHHDVLIEKGMQYFFYNKTN